MGMKFALIRKFNKSTALLRKQLEKAGHKYSVTNPDIVISVGGDGTFLLAEQNYPSVPKILVRESSVCNTCHTDNFEQLISKLKKPFRIEKHMKLEAVLKRKGKVRGSYHCTNEFSIRNRNMRHAIRFEVFVNKKQIDHLLIGDGVVVATPFGSTAYHYSITKKAFKRGIGIAFNNLTVPLTNILAKETDTIAIRLIRGEADLARDNAKELIPLKPGDIVEVKKSRLVTKLVRL